jgi:hypothetical protein
MERLLFDRHAAELSVLEPTTAGPTPADGLAEDEKAFYRYLLGLPKGRIEQEFLPREAVTHVLSHWAEE